MKFYTNFFQKSNKIFVRGYNFGERFTEEIRYHPYLFVRSQKSDSQYRTHDGKVVDKVDFDSISEARNFIQQYAQVDNFPIYGLTNWQYAYINDNYQYSEYVEKLIRCVNIDIETKFDETGFPHAKLANHEIIAITLQWNENVIVLGLKDFEPPENVKYIKCADEEALLRNFLYIWKNIDPDVVTGWNCIPSDQSVWTSGGIKKIKKISEGDDLNSRFVKTVYPKTYKERYDIVLSNKMKIGSSLEHKFSGVMCKSEKYTKFTFGKSRNDIKFEDKTLEEIIEARNNGYEIFLEHNVHENKLPDNMLYTDSELYLAGLIYTDGSLSEKNKNWGYSIYQSDFEMLSILKEKYNIPSKIVGPYEKCYSLYINPVFVPNASELIYDNFKKSLNLEKLSTLSKRQFNIFMSGMLDGDGFVVGDTTLSLCDYTESGLAITQELLLWNGVVSSIYGSAISIYDDLQNYPVIKKKRWGQLTNKSSFKRITYAKACQTRWKAVNNTLYVRVFDIIKSGEIVEMMDIETSDHYFETKGFKVHNCDRFDIPYIINRIRRILSNEDANSLSPYGIINDKTVNTKYGEELMYEIVGVASLDYLELYKKFSFKVQESYALDYICEEELSERKLDYSEYKDLMDLYIRNPQRFFEYNIHDVVLVKRLNDKLGFLEQAYAIAYRTKTNYVDAFTSVRMWDIIIHNYLLEQNIVIPTTNNNKKQKQIVGGHVKDPNIGKYEWFCSFDANSLYPHLIRQYNISPEMYIGKNQKWVFNTQEELDANIERIIKNKDIGLDIDDVCMTASGCYFSTKKRGFLSELMIAFYDGRTVHKKKMIEYKKEKEICTDDARKEELTALIAKEHNMQLALKILLNSCYGSLANEYFRWYNDDLAESITASGQLSIRWAAYKFNLFMNNLAGTNGKDYVIAIDTDSVYLNMQVVVDKYLNKNPAATKTEIANMLDNFCKKVMDDYIEKSFEELRSIMHGFEQAMHMKRENIASGIFIAKKRYASYIFNEEGVVHAKPKLKITGLESVRSSTPRVCRKAINETIELMFSQNEDNLIKYIDNFRSKFYNMSFEEVAKPSGVNGIVDYTEQDGTYKKGTPQHVKGAILYNQHLKKLNLQNKYRQITDGSKLRLINLKMPNPIRDNVFACPNELPQEFGLNKYIDYDTQFQKTYLDPITAIAKVVGWKTENKESVDDFYS